MCKFSEQILHLFDILAMDAFPVADVKIFNGYARLSAMSPFVRLL